MNRKKKIVNLLVATSILTTGGTFIAPISASAQVNAQVEGTFKDAKTSMAALDFVTKHNLGIENTVVLEQMKSDFISQQERGMLGSFNDGLKFILKYVNFLPDCGLKTLLKNALEPLKKLLNTGQLITVSVLQITLKAWGWSDFWIEALIDLVHFIIW